MSKQIKFLDIENAVEHGGILLDDGNVICGCCGGIFEADEEGITWKLVHAYDTWIDLTSEICGDDLRANMPVESTSLLSLATRRDDIPERISKEMIRRGLTDEDIKLVEYDGEVVAEIGEHWFHFGAVNGDLGIDVHSDTTPFDDDVEAIWEAINADPINGPTEEESTECLYYKAYLQERFRDRDAEYAGREIHYSMEEQIDACYRYLNWTDSHKNPYEMTEDELLSAEIELENCVPGIAWVDHAGYTTTVPQDKSNGYLILS